MKFRTWLIATLIFLIAATGVQAQLTSGDIDRLVKKAMKEFNVAGAAVGVVKDGRIVHAKGYGVQSVKSKEAVNRHTNFAIASNSKAFTTAALAILVEEGRIAWDDKVVKYIPEFRMYDDWVTAHFNIVDLLTHRSGLGLGAGDLMVFPSGGDYSMKDIIGAFQHFQPASDFRTKYDYDNLLYMVAGEVIKRVTGQSWEEFVQHRILDKIGMESSYSSLALVKNRDNLATPHFDDGESLNITEHDSFDLEKLNGAAGSILANVDDLCQWLLLHLNHGKYGENLENMLFTPQSQQYMWTIHTVTRVNRNPRYNAHFSGYGLGWALTDLKGNLSVSHTGALSGMLSKTLMIPDQNLGLVILTNTWMGGAMLFSAVSNSIVDSYLGLDEFDWISHYKSRSSQSDSRADSVVSAVWAKVEANKDAAVGLQCYQGVFEDPWFGKVKIALTDEGLRFSSLRSPRLTGRMYFYNANAFAIKWDERDMDADAFAVFSLDEEGRALSIRMKGISPNIDFSYDFQDLRFSRIEE